MTTRALEAVLFREAKIRATNLTFIFWDLLYPLGYLLVFGLGMNASLGFTKELSGLDYNAFFLAGVLGMASFGIASNTSWSFFLDRDNGIFYEMLTYPLSRSQYLVGKVLFNVGIALVQALLTVALSAMLLHVAVLTHRLLLLVGGDGDRDVGLVLLLRDLCVADSPQRYVQRPHVGVLFPVLVCELDVLSVGAAAEGVPICRVTESDHVACRCPPIRDHWRRRTANDRHRSRQASSSSRWWRSGWRFGRSSGNS